MPARRWRARRPRCSAQARRTRSRPGRRTAAASRELLVRLDAPGPAERPRQLDGAAFYLESRLAAARGERIGIAARKCIAGEGGGGRAVPQQFCDGGSLADAHLPARRIQADEAVLWLRQQAAEASPTRRNLLR